MECSSYNNQVMQQCGVPAIENLFRSYPQLRVYEDDIRARYGMFEKTKMSIEREEGLERFTQGHKEFGVMMTEDRGVRCMNEWIPNAKAVYLKGEFNNWNLVQYREIGFGKWELFIPPNRDGSCAIRHCSELKIVIETKDNQRIERISPWAKYVVQREANQGFKWRFWNPTSSQRVQFTHTRPNKPDRLRIYEAHIGIASDRCEVSTYRHFTSNVLPRIRDQGYNSLLLMAVIEHSYYPSWGYQVTNYFATSSRYGTPEEFKELVQTAHGMGIYVMVDVMHGEASKNVLDGLNMFDGTEACFFEEGARSFNNEHDTRIFDYKKWETIRFLMSHLRYYVNEYHVDGFRFNGMSSMIFHDSSKHVVQQSLFRDNQDSQYFGMQMKTDGLAYIMLMNDMLHNFYPNVITIAEDVPGMPALCRPVSEGGLGFDYRLSKDAANVWAKLFNDTRDEDWNMHFIRQIIKENRVEEKRIMFTEHHEQNEVGRMTMSRKLIGDSSMSESQQLTLCLDRGLSLYKMTRLFTHAFAGQGFLNFIGNEFGHPDWVELPSPSNNDSYQLARRQFHLADNQQLRYKFLNRFDRAMNKTEERYGWLKSNQAVVTRAQESDKVFVFERAGLIFAFNFHPTKSYPDYRIPVERFGSYKIVLDTDDRCFGGHSRNQPNVEFHAKTGHYDNFPNSMMIYLPSRSALVLSLSNLAHGSNHGNSGNNVCNSYYGSGQNDSTRGCTRNVRLDIERHSGSSRYDDANRSTSGAYGNDHNSGAYGQDSNRQSCNDGYSNQGHGYNSRQQYW
ncbi:LOW QUALITY PROTEIN: 1,4-alpha-glucan-branching enzyme-like [Ciona intestinalis]